MAELAKATLSEAPIAARFGRTTTGEVEMTGACYLPVTDRDPAKTVLFFSGPAVLNRRAVGAIASLVLMPLVVVLVMVAGGVPYEGGGVP